MHHPRHQHGSVLVISLIMLVVMTLLAVTSINMSTVNLRIVGNMQSQMEAESAVQTAIEGIVSSLANFDTPATTTATISGYGVQVSAPLCVMSAQSEGFEATYSINATAGTRLDNDWLVTAQNTTDTRGEHIEITQGVRVRGVLVGCP
jgi:Tfp pilus assembly protein PilX